MGSVRGVKALRRFTVRAHLPERLAALGTLSTNLRWSWHPPTQDLFASIDPELWVAVRNDPVRMLGEVDPYRLDELAVDAGFLADLDRAAADLDDYLTRPRWYQDQLDKGAELATGIAYFSMEFGVTEVLPNYSGGLGILAGDHLKAASDLGLPLIGVGLLYRSGYFRQSLTADGWQAEHYPAHDPQGLPLRLLTERSGDGGAGAPVLVHVAMPGGRVLRARVWIAQVGRVPLLLLDSDIAENDPELRAVTDRLYGGDQDHRIKQEILAGVGGVRAVRAFTRAHGLADPEVFHMNEGMPVSSASSASGNSSPAPDWTSTRRSPRSAPARCSPRTPPSRPASTGSRWTWSAATSAGTRANETPRCCPVWPWTGSWPSAARTTRACSTWRTWAFASASAPTVSRSCTAR